jgi:hypothetical protein
MHFITNDYFTFGTENKNVTNIFRTRDGEKICSLDTRSFFYVLRSINPENIDHKIMGIYDVISQKVYKPNLKTLMFFGAQEFVIGPMNKIFNKEVNSIYEDSSKHE